MKKKTEKQGDGSSAFLAVEVSEDGMYLDFSPPKVNKSKHIPPSLTDCKKQKNSPLAF